MNGPDGNIFFNLALAHKKLGHDEEAATVFKEAVKLDPQYLQYQQFFLGS
ncbi:MAG: tetratricopeptide repeat protein [bacterium]|nr:tetratricopeptide repeat protein [bacterium]